MIHFTINGQISETAPGTTILKAARMVGITIPTLCYHHDLSPYGGCPDARFTHDVRNISQGCVK